MSVVTLDHTENYTPRKLTGDGGYREESERFLDSVSQLRMNHLLRLQSCSHVRCVDEFPGGLDSDYQEPFLPPQFQSRQAAVLAVC